MLRKLGADHSKYPGLPPPPPGQDSVAADLIDAAGAHRFTLEDVEPVLLLATPSVEMRPQILLPLDHLRGKALQYLGIQFAERQVRRPDPGRRQLRRGRARARSANVTSRSSSSSTSPAGPRSSSRSSDPPLGTSTPSFSAGMYHLPCRSCREAITRW
jgi:hypothetical protein